MALSDYLTDDEWDACFYASMGGKAVSNDFGAAMHKTIRALLEIGYEFQGLDGDGNKKQQLPSGNASKILIWLGNPHHVDILAILENGRNFLKKHRPDWVDETDEEWAKQMEDARKKQTEDKDKK